MPIYARMRKNLLRIAILPLLFLVVSCNLTASGKTPPAATLSPETEEIVLTASPEDDGYILEILSPLPDSEVPAEEPLVVTARFTGGAATDARLLVDSQPVTDWLSPVESGKEFTLIGQAPAEGKHRLEVELLDQDKISHFVGIDITVRSRGGGATPGGPTVSFVALPGGSVLTAWVDAYGFSYANTTVEAGGDSVKDIILEADGLQVARAHNDSYTTPFRADMAWTPYRGNGTYTLTAYARTADFAENYFVPIANSSVSIDVEGIPDGTLSIRDRFIQLFSERFSLSVPIPAFARYFRPVSSAIDPSQWVSVAYIGDYDYEIDLLDDGTVHTNRMVMNRAEYGLATICRPTGTYSMLVVFVDYGNTGVTQDQAFSALADAQTRSASWHQAYAAGHGLPAPLLQINTTPAFIVGSPAPGEFLTAAQIQSRTGYSTRDFNLTAQVDLDSGASLSAVYHALGFATYGGCLPGGSEKVNLFMTIQSPGDLDIGLYGSLLVHELSHDLGWQHWWPTGSGGANDQSLWNNDNSAFASLFFGWQDVDGDGTVEIFDLTPYGR